VLFDVELRYRNQWRLPERIPLSCGNPVTISSSSTSIAAMR
jgi:hypothetical protein